jgi:3-oxoacyl-[acyl-carrier protein] reductase
VALIVGGTKGIGLAVAKAFAAEGVKVFVASRDPANVDAAVQEINSGSGNAAGCAADCMTAEGLERAVSGARGAFGPIDIAVFIPFATLIGSFQDMDDDAFQRGDNNLVLSFARLARAVIPDMQARKWGRILTVGSMCVRMAHRHIPRAAANTYRLAGVGLSKQLADEFGRDGITVNTLGTGSILTPAFVETFTAVAEKEGKTFEEVEAYKAADIPIGRLGRPEEMADAALFLCSDRASFITGQTLLVDGGRVPSPL